MAECSTTLRSNRNPPPVPSVTSSANSTSWTVTPFCWRPLLLIFGVFAAGAYGGYFGAAQGVLLVGIMSALMATSLQRINGLKNVLGTVGNAVAAVTSILV